MALMDSHPPLSVDPSRLSPARMYDYFLGGTDNFPVDREAAEGLLRISPEARELVRAQRRFTFRAVRHFVQAGFRQFIDLGAGLPMMDNVHQVAVRLSPGARIVYVDNDPIVLAHGRALLMDAPNTIYLEADLRDARVILDHPDTRALIDFDEPVALLLSGTLPYLADADDPAALIAEYAAALPGGSQIAITHATSDGGSEPVKAQLLEVYGRGTAPLHLRTTGQIAALLGDLPLIDPGLVDIQYWRPDDDAQPGDLRNLAGIVRVP